MKSHNIYNRIYGTQDESSRSTMLLISGIAGIWFLSAFIGGMTGIFYQPGVPPFSVGLFVLIPIAGFTLAYGVSTRFRTAVDGIPLWLITITHTWRFVGLGFVIGAMMHVLPPQFGYPEGLGDIIAAALCLPLARALREKGPSPRLRKAFIAWTCSRRSRSGFSILRARSVCCGRIFPRRS
jgi:hypothetical protein